MIRKPDARRAGIATAISATVALALAVGPAANAADFEILVPDDFIAAASGTTPTGHYDVVGTGLRVWTDAATSADRVQEFYAYTAPLATVGEPGLNFTNTTGGGLPGMQLVIDFDADGVPDGTLVGEPAAYGANWWLTAASWPLVAGASPSATGTATGSGGSPYFGTLDQWRATYPSAVVGAFGFSLGSGVLGDGIINFISISGDRYFFGPEDPIVTPPVTPVTPTEPTLAETGAELNIALAVVSAVLVLGGAATLIASRRRRVPRH